MLIIGLTGGIASGKSIVMRTFRELEVPTFDADVMARQLTEPHQPAWREILGHFGEDLCLADGTLDRARLGTLVFSDPEKRRVLEGIVLPRMKEYLYGQRDQLAQQGKTFLIIEGATILEANYRGFCDSLIVVHTTPEVQLQRLIERNGYSREEALLRVQAQMPLEEKVKYADFVIYNTGSLEETLRQVRELHGHLRSLPATLRARPDALRESPSPA
ncbi:MAG: dephospho-CoA kinase [Candidatus Tectomicrobia bacterium]|uniref:Dephospho-CoA kinase n=1 Tax=Tectimicrobiota bacterium TaxID=2528274 RepID=A0A932CRD4_UNCTE|nr:dephospho-CoA kinase [Candidatus Tectomicrobia bacterium]